jgi:hypothetical protein
MAKSILLANFGPEKGNEIGLPRARQKRQQKAVEKKSSVLLDEV